MTFVNMDSPHATEPRVILGQANQGVDTTNPSVGALIDINLPEFFRVGLLDGPQRVGRADDPMPQAVTGERHGQLDDKLLPVGDDRVIPPMHSVDVGSGNHSLPSAGWCYSARPERFSFGQAVKFRKQPVLQVLLIGS